MEINGFMRDHSLTSCLTMAKTSSQPYVSLGIAQKYGPGDVKSARLGERQGLLLETYNGRLRRKSLTAWIEE